eukprot:TRINITY_DN9821_c0_g1_i2.p1 TRINITY_DN9821_c0_g1~~TRINITY_DN9821_c0_g1_i2.p1  ORF type:complete len:789 (-),score=253.30 TRINITY_DN9821_c0_g1_i2:694-3006(-)
MAQPEESFKVCGLCSQLVDEAVKLTDILLDFLTKFLNVDGSNLPSKICTECFQGAIDSKKFKEKCQRTVEKLKKTHISSTMILGRSNLDVKQMKHKFKNGLDLLDPELETDSKVKDENPGSNQIITKPPLPGEAINASIEALSSGQRSAGRTSSRNSSLGSSNEDTPLSSRSKKSSFRRSSSISSHPEMYAPHMQPKIRISSSERKVADDMLIERSRSGRVLKRKVASPEDPVPLDFLKAKKVKTEPGPDTFPYRPGNTSKAKPKSKAPRGFKGYAIIEEPTKDSDVYDADDGEEEIFPSLGPYQCEICQEITDTKQEFVAHIKALHKDMVDEAVLRSLESDLKKRKKKEMAASPVKKPLKPVKPEAPPVGSPLKINEKLKPRARPIQRYTEVESDDEYKPSKNKKFFKKKSPSKIDIDPAIVRSKMEPGNCHICGASLSRASDIPKHQESLKCRQAAFNLAQERHKKAKEEQKLVQKESEEGLGDVMSEKEEVKKISVIEEKISEIDKNDVDAIANKVLEDTFGKDKVLEDTFGNSSNTFGHNPNKVMDTFGSSSAKEVNGTRVSTSDSDDVAHNVPKDNKFKASIAKRYEAERNDSSDSKETDSALRDNGLKTTDTDEYELEDDDFDEAAAIKAAMQESLETAQKEQSQAPVKVSTPPNKTNSPSVGDHSPAAYIDPAPQPDVEPYRDPNKSSVIVPNMSKHGITGKEWVDSCREPTTVDLEALGEPTSLPPPPPVHMDSLESQMAALHGAAGANTPWQEFNENYFGH